MPQAISPIAFSRTAEPAVSEPESFLNAALNYLQTLRSSGIEHLALSSTKGAKPPDLQNQTSGESRAGAQQPARKKAALLTLCETVRQCTLCAELAQTRTQTVFGAGYAQAKVVFVGEAPGFDEDREGLPFIGEAGQLLTKMIESIGLRRDRVFICNVLKCHPPQNRNPKPEEVTNCSPYLRAQLEVIKPSVVCALGRFSAQALLQTTRSISQLRGTLHTLDNFRLICTFHPAYLLRNPAEKRKAWEDLKLLLSVMESS